MEPLPHRHQHSSSQPMLVPSSSFPVGKTVGAISCTTMTLFTKCYPPPLGTRINNTVPALKTTTVNRPVLALKKNARPGANKKYNRPVPALKKHNHPVPSRLEKKIQPPRSASKKKYNRPVPPRKKKKTAPSRFGKKKRPPRPASKKNKPPRPASKKKKNVPSRQEFPPLYFASPALPPK